MCLQIIGRQVSPQCISHLNGKLLYKKTTSASIGQTLHSFSNPNKKELSDSLIGIIMGIALPTRILLHFFIQSQLCCWNRVEILSGFIGANLGVRSIDVAIFCSFFTVWNIAYISSQHDVRVLCRVQLVELVPAD